MSFSAPQPLNRQPLTKEEIKQSIKTVKDLIHKIAIEEDQKPEALIQLLSQYPFNAPEMLAVIFSNKFYVDPYGDDQKSGLEIVVGYLKPEDINKWNYFLKQASTQPPYDLFKSTGARGWADAILKFGLTASLREKLNEMDIITPEITQNPKRMHLYEQIFHELMIDFFKLGTVENDGRDLEWEKEIVGLRRPPNLKQEDFAEILRNCRHGDYITIHFEKDVSDSGYNKGYRFATFNGLLQYLSYYNWKSLINQIGILRFAVMLAEFFKTANVSFDPTGLLFDDKKLRKEWTLYTLNLHYIHSPAVSLNCNPLLDVEEKERNTIKNQFRDYLNNIARLFRKETRFHFLKEDLPSCMATITKMVPEGDQLLKETRLNDAEVVLRDMLNYVASEIEKQQKSNKEVKNAKKPLDLLLLQQYQQQLHFFLAKIYHAQLEHIAWLSSAKPNISVHKNKIPNKKELKENVSQSQLRLQALNYYMMADEATLLKTSPNDLYAIGKFMFFLNSADDVFLNLEFKPTPYQIQTRGLKMLKLAIEQGDNLAIQELEHIFIGSSKAKFDQKFFKAESKAAEKKLNVSDVVRGLDFEATDDVKKVPLQQKIMIAIDNEINQLIQLHDIFKVLKNRISEIKEELRIIKKCDDKEEIELDLNNLVKTLSTLPKTEEEDRLIVVAELFVDIRGKILNLPEDLPKKIIPKIKEMEIVFKNYLKPKESKEGPRP